MDNSSKDNKGNVIAEIDVNVHITGLPPRNWILETIEEHLNCILCGTEMTFKHVVDHIAQNVKEEGHCPHCKVRGRASEHSLQ